MKTCYRSYREEAPKVNRSLNNFVESTLMDAMYSEPNEETLAAMKEAESGIELETLELDSFKDFVQSDL